MTVLRALRLEPLPAIAHKIAEPVRVLVPGVLDEGRKTRGHRFRQSGFARGRQRARQQEGTGVVVDAVAMSAVGDRVDSVLEQTGAIAHRQKMTGLQFGQGVTAAPQVIEPD